MDYKTYLEQEKLLAVSFNKLWNPQQLFANKFSDPGCIFLRRYEKEHGFKKMLDLACGYATTSYYLKNKDKIIGVDISQDILDIITHIMTQQADAHSLPFEVKTFDLVLIDGSMEFFLRPIVVLQECRRVMTDNAILFITNVRDDMEHGLGAPLSWSLLAFEEILTSCGLDFIRYVGFDKQHMSYICRRRM